MSHKIRCLLLILSTGLLPALAQEPAHHHDRAEALGTVNFPVSCGPEVQKDFTRAMALLYSFEYEQAQLAFAKVAESDPECAMAYWGQAMTLYHPLWDRPAEESLQRGRRLTAKASGLSTTSGE